MVFFPAAPVRVCVVVTSVSSAPDSSSGRPGGRPLTSVDVTQPLRIFAAAAMHLIEIGRLQFLGDGAEADAAEGAAVHFADRSDFRGGAGEEGLVGDVHFVVGVV